MKRLLAYFSRTDRLHALAAAAVALLPLVIFRAEFAKLFWFGDEWDLLDQIDQLGFGRWTVLAFAENFVPLFKLAWGGIVHLFGGSYFALLVILWLSHALNTVLLGRLLRRAGFGWTATLFSQACFALVPDNMETLGWGVQWSAVLAVTFMLLGLDILLRRPPETTPPQAGFDAVLWCSAGSALSFSRGVLTGGILWLACLWEDPARIQTKRLGRALCYLLPSIAVAITIALCANGNHRQLGEGKLWAAAQYAAWYFSLNPFYGLLDADSWGPLTTTLLAVTKLALIIRGLWRHAGTVRRLLVLLLVFDLGNAVLLGIGRFHTGLETVISSRYQYGALLATLPFAALWLDALLQRLPDRTRRPGAILAVSLLIALFCRHWPAEVALFCDSRGTQTRRLIFEDKNPPAQGAVPGIATLSTARARELAGKFHLH